MGGFDYKPESRCYCQWCAKRGLRREFYKLRDGPIDWWFCNDDHALEWLEKRHTSVQINRYLRMTPRQRRLYSHVPPKGCVHSS